MNVLIVDDHPINLKLLRAVLEADGATVSEATDGIEALGILKLNGIDAVVSDMSMPHMDGYQLCMEVRADPQSFDVPFIAYSATYTSPDDERIMMEIGADYFLQKPTSAAAISSSLQEAVRVRRRRPPSSIRPRLKSSPINGCNHKYSSDLEERDVAPTGKPAGTTKAEDEPLKSSSCACQTLGQFRQMQKMETLGTLAGGIAHDLNNILHGICRYSELAREEAEGNATLTEYLDGLMRGAHRATALVRQIVGFSQHRAEERQPIRLGPIVMEAMQLLRSSVPVSIQFQTSVADDVPIVFADATQIYQVIMNLGANAAYAMKSRKGRLEVKLESLLVAKSATAVPSELRVGRYAMVTVRDNGIGMDAKTLGRIFEPYFTTKPAGEGSGRGLAIVHSVVKSHDGVITVSSELGEGTTIRIYLPANHVAIVETTPAARKLAPHSLESTP